MGPLVRWIKYDRSADTSYSSICSLKLCCVVESWLCLLLKNQKWRVLNSSLGTFVRKRGIIAKVASDGADKLISYFSADG